MNKKKIMILGASSLQLPAIIEAKKMGLDVIAVDMDINAVGFKYADICLPLSTNDIFGVLKLATEHRIDGIITLASDLPMRTIAVVSSKLGLPGLDIDTAYRATDKAKMRQCLSENGVPIPKSYRVNSYDEYIEITKTFQSSIIIKPTDNSGSRGVYKIDYPFSEKHIEYAYLYSKQHSRSGEIVVEEFMDGEEVSVETLSINGKCNVIQITDKITNGSPRFVEMGHSQPTHHTGENYSRIIEVASSAVAAVGIKEGPSHTEIMVTKEGPKIIELGARLGGDYITTHLVPLSTGINMVESCINIAIGNSPNIEQKWERGSAIRYIRSHKGIIESISGLEIAKKIDGISEIGIFKAIGDNINNIESSADRIGYVIAGSNNAMHAVEICELALATINICIR